MEKSEIFRLSEILRRRSEIFITYLYKNALSFAKMFYFTNYEVLIAISKIMKGVINDEKIDMISKFHNLDAQMLLSEANIFTALHAMQTRSSDENSRIISSSWIKKYNNVTYYTTDKKSTYDVSMSTGGHLVHI